MRTSGNTDNDHDNDHDNNPAGRSKPHNDDRPGLSQSGVSNKSSIRVDDPQLSINCSAVVATGS